MKGIILYQSRNGSTKTYAEWLAQDLGFDCRPVKKAGKLTNYDTIVLGSNVRAYKIAMGPWIKRRWDALKGKTLALFSVAGEPKESPKREQWITDSVGPEIQSALRHFPLDGRKVMAQMKWLDRKIMALAVKMTAKKDPEEAK